MQATKRRDTLEPEATPELMEIKKTPKTKGPLGVSLKKWATIIAFSAWASLSLVGCGGKPEDMKPKQISAAESKSIVKEIILADPQVASRIASGGYSTPIEDIFGFQATDEPDKICPLPKNQRGISFYQKTDGLALHFIVDTKEKTIVTAVPTPKLKTRVERPKDPFDIKGFDVTQVMNNLGEREGFNLEVALGDRLTPQFSNAWTAALAMGVTNQQVHDLLSMIRNAKPKIEKRASEVMGQKFTLNEVRLTMEEASNVGIEPTTPRVYVNLLDKGLPLVIDNIGSVLAHEVGHLVHYKGEMRMAQEHLDRNPYVPTSGAVTMKDIPDSVFFGLGVEAYDEASVNLEEIRGHKVGMMLTQDKEEYKRVWTKLTQGIIKEKTQESKDRGLTATDIMNAAMLSALQAEWGNTELSERVDDLIAKARYAKSLTPNANREEINQSYATLKTVYQKAYESTTVRTQE